MRAALLSELPAEGFQIRDVADPRPGRATVVVEVEACGICGTDLHIMAGTSYRPELPFIMGHEPVGKVVALGPDVDERLLGTRVVPTLFIGCGVCISCRAGDERLCDKGALVTGVLGVPGGFAELLALGTEQLVEVPEGVDALAAATLVDAGATAQNAARVASSDAVPAGPSLVVGAGPVGLLAAELLRVSGHEVAIVERLPQRADAAARLGYPTEVSVDRVSGPFAAVVDCAADPGAVERELELLRPRGWFLAVGYSTVPRLDLSVVARRELTIRGIRSGSRHDLATVLDVVARGAIRLPEAHRWRLEEIDDAFRSLRSGALPGKAVIVMNGSIQ